jgi:hypothetical protein
MNFYKPKKGRDCRGRDHMVVGFTTTYAISDYRHWCCELESRSPRGVQHYEVNEMGSIQIHSGRKCSQKIYFFSRCTIRIKQIWTMYVYCIYHSMSKSKLPNCLKRSKTIFVLFVLGCPLWSSFILLPFLSVAQHESGTRKSICWNFF